MDLAQAFAEAVVTVALGGAVAAVAWWWNRRPAEMVFGQGSDTTNDDRERDLRWYHAEASCRTSDRPWRLLRPMIAREATVRVFVRNSSKKQEGESWQWTGGSDKITLNHDVQTIPIVVGNLGDSSNALEANGQYVDPRAWKLTPQAHGNLGRPLPAIPGDVWEFEVAISWVHNERPAMREALYELRIPTELDGEPAFVFVRHL